MKATTPTPPRPARVLLVCICAAAIAATGSVPAGASPAAHRSIIEVFPGPHAIEDALASANPGDILNIHGGTYPGHLAVGKSNITLQAAGDGKVVINARCRARDAIYVTADGVAIVGLTIEGADEGFGLFPSEVYFEFAASGSIRNSVLKDTCNAEYGVNVFGSQMITVEGNLTRGFSDAGIYIGGITSTGTGALDVMSNEMYGNNRGVIVEDSSGGTIRVRSNAIHDNAGGGILLTNSDAVRVRNNSVTDDGTDGIRLEATSDGNQITGNTVSGHTYDLRNDGGAGNCFRNNTYTTSLGNVGC